MHRLPNQICAFLIILLCGEVVSIAHAQSLPGSADPSRFDKVFGEPTVDTEKDIQAPQDYSVDTNIPEATDGFVLNAVHLSGLSVFSQQNFQPLINEYTDRSVDLNVLNHLAARITSRYHEHGYFLSKVLVPVQEIEGGNVTLQIIEGHVHDVIIDDPSDLLGSDALNITNDTITKIKALNPLHGATLERYMLLLNEGAGVHVQSIMSSATDAGLPGAINVTLKVSKKPQNFLLNYNNHGSKFVGPHQAEIAYIVGRLFSPYDRLTLQTTTTIPMREVQYGSVAYALPLNEEGLRFDTFVSYANSEPGSTLKILEVESDSFSWEGGLTYPLTRSRRTNLDIGASMNIRNSATEFLDAELIDDKVRSVILNANYDTQDDDGSLNSAAVSLHKGLDVFGATETGSADLSRTQGRSDFVKIEVSAARIQQLHNDFNVLAQMEGQYAPHPLLSSEEFGFGGADLGRAYDPSELTGDQGIAGAVELRYTGVTPLNNNIFLTPFAFYDIGKVWNEDTGSKPLSAASAGFGTYFQVGQPVSGSFTVAYPLTKSVTTPIMGDPHGPRILLDFNTRF